MKITLCGSTRFQAAFAEWMTTLSLSGHIVYGLAMFGREATDVGKGDNVLVSEEQKVTLDLIHLRKIMESDAVVVLNPGGYVGFSTRREIEWARMLGREVYALEPLSDGAWTDASTLVRKAA